MLGKASWGFEKEVLVNGEDVFLTVEGWTRKRSDGWGWAVTGTMQRLRGKCKRARESVVRF